MTAAKLARHLGGRKAGASYMACCPAHSDRNPSLAISERADRLLVHCHAGCSQAAIIEALTTRGLWTTQAKHGGIEERIRATYDYTDERGKLLYQVCRLEPKDFRQRRPDGRGGWHWNLRGVKRVLYRLPELREAAIVFLVEGEKDVETLRERGFVATTPAGGAKAPWLPEYTETLRGREVIVVPDNDGPGWQRAEQIARVLLHNVARLRLLPLPKGIKDISEFFDKGHSEVELISELEGCANV